MRASAWEFRLRTLILTVLIVLGFWAPWDRWLGQFGFAEGQGPSAHLWGTAAAYLGRQGVGIAAAFEWLLAGATVVAALGALLRTWAAAYLGSGVVKDAAMQGGAVVADGPFRFVRNPLYIGLWLNVLALAMLMPPSGAVFAVVTVALFELRLILAEERFLGERQGAAYAAYCARVPRIVPALRPRVARSGTTPRWWQAVVGEIYPWGTAVSFAALGWRYSAVLIVQGVLVSLGLSLVLRAFLRADHADSSPVATR